jgi:hypothetical protein
LSSDFIEKFPCLMLKFSMVSMFSSAMLPVSEGGTIPAPEDSMLRFVDNFPCLMLNFSMSSMFSSTMLPVSEDRTIPMLEDSMLRFIDNLPCLMLNFSVVFHCRLLFTGAFFLFVLPALFVLSRRTSRDLTPFLYFALFRCGKRKVKSFFAKTIFPLAFLRIRGYSYRKLASNQADRPRRRNGEKT